MDDVDPYFGKKAQRKAVVDWVTRALEGVVNGLMCGDLYDDCPGAFSGSLDEALRLASWGDEKKLHRAVNLATLSMGQVAYNIKSRLFPRIVALLTEYRNRLRVNGSMKHFAKEFSKCYDLLYTELECMPARKKVRIWASYPEGQEEFREFDVEYFFPYSGMSPEEATRKSRNIAVRNHKKEYGKGEYTELSKAMAEVFKLLSQEAEKGLAGRALPHMTANIIKRILNHGGELIWESYKEIPENLLPHEIHGEEVTEETVESRARASVIDAMRRYFASASNLAVHTGSDAAAMFSELSSLLETFDTTLTVIFHDSQVQETHTFGCMDLPLQLAPRGGGGTDYRPVCAWIDREGLHPVCLLWFTDLECTSFPEQPEYPVLWIIDGRKDNPPPFGEWIVIN